MTLLDDFEAAHKLEGIHVVRGLLVHAPPDLLKRTGVADLCFSVSLCVHGLLLWRQRGIDVLT